MKIVYWQNIISPHQSFLIRNLSKRNEVILAVLEEISEERLQQGWVRPDVGNAEVIVLESRERALDLFADHKNAIHLFSGIASYPVIKDVFHSLDKYSNVGVIVEAGSPLGWQKYFRKLLYAWKYVKYKHKIDVVFAMGDLGVQWYHSVGFPKSKLIKFQYFTELPNLETLEERDIDAPPQLLFIGQLIDRKNIQGLVDALISLKGLNYNLNIIGDGLLRSTLENLVQQNNVEDRIKFLGNIDNTAAMTYLSESDYLILPSEFDGWGAVINEALSRGVKVITNESCGASCLVKEMNWGTVYNDTSTANLLKTLQHIIENFKRESITSRKLTGAKFAENYAYRSVEKFEELVRTKWGS